MSLRKSLLYVLDLEMAVAYWNLVLTGRFKFLDLWNRFLLVREDVFLLQPFLHILSMSLTCIRLQTSFTKLVIISDSSICFLISSHAIMLMSRSFHIPVLHSGASQALNS